MKALVRRSLVVASWLIAVAILVFNSRAHGQSFEVMDHCDARTLPTSDARTIAGTNGHRTEDAVIGDWFLATVVYQEIVRGTPYPFAFDSNKPVNSRVVGFFAHHLSDSRQWYCKIPREWQPPWDHFDFFVSARDEVCFSCAVGGGIQYGRWKIGTAPELVEARKLVAVPDRLPSEIPGHKLTRWIRGATWYPGPPDVEDDEEVKGLQVSHLDDTDFLCLSESGSILGRFSATTSDWKWRSSLDVIQSDVGKHYREFKIPALIPPARTFVLAGERSRESRQVDVILVEPQGARVIATVPDAGLFAIHLSPDQHFVLLECTKESRAITDFIEGSLIDLRTSKITSVDYGENGTQPAIGIGDAGRIVHAGEEIDVMVSSVTELQSSGHANQFDVLLPPLAVRRDK